MFLSRLSAAVTQYPTQALKSLLVHFVCLLQSFIEFFTFLSFIFWSNLIHPGIVFKPYLIRHDVNALNSFAMLLTWKLRLTCDADPYSVYLCFCTENPFRLIFNSESNALFHVMCVCCSKFNYQPRLLVSRHYHCLCSSTSLRCAFHLKLTSVLRSNSFKVPSNGLCWRHSPWLMWNHFIRSRRISFSTRRNFFSFLSSTCESKMLLDRINSIEAICVQHKTYMHFCQWTWGHNRWI